MGWLREARQSGETFGKGGFMFGRGGFWECVKREAWVLNGQRSTTDWDVMRLKFVNTEAFWGTSDVPTDAPETFKAMRVLQADLSAAFTENGDLRAALDAAQDEIERLISEKEALRAERDMLKRGGEQLGKIIDRQGRDVIELTDSQDIIREDGDGDWEVVWERLHDMKRERDQFSAALKSVAPAAHRMIVGGES